MPAPTRSSSESFPQRWGYAVGLGSIVLGIVLAAVIIVGGFFTLYQDVRNFERSVGRGEVIADLEAGEYTIYDERDGLSLGPFNVTVVRLSDGATIPAESVADGADYNIDGRSGEARASVRIPTAGQYKIDVAASPGSVLSFAVGKGTITGPTGFVGRGLGLFALFGVAGVVLLLWTAYKHAQWRVRGALDQRLEQGREVVNATAGPGADLRSGSEAALPGRIDAVAERARRAVERARTEAAKLGTPPPPVLPPPSGDRAVSPGPNPQPPDWASQMADRAGAAIDESQLRAQAGAGDVVQRVGGEAEAVAEALDQAIARVQTRLRSGESLRNIVRDEGPAAVEAAQAQVGRSAAAAEAARSDAAMAVEAARVQAIKRGADTRSDLANDVAGIRSEALEQVRTAVDDARSGVTPIADDLLGDVGLVAAGAAGASGAAVAAAARELKGSDFEFDDLVAGWRPGDGPPADGSEVEPIPAPADSAVVDAPMPPRPGANEQRPIAPVGPGAIEPAPFGRPLAARRPVAEVASVHKALILVPPPPAQLLVLRAPLSQPPLPGDRASLAGGDVAEPASAATDAADGVALSADVASEPAGSTLSLAPPPRYRPPRERSRDQS